MPRPTLVVVSGPPGSGKTTLAHELARRIGCPAVCRDEIKEGMFHADPGLEPGPADQLNWPTLHLFFDVLEVLLKANVTVVAESAFQDKLWRPGLERLAPLANIRIIHCSIPATLAYDRRLRRKAADPLRRAHEDLAQPPTDAAAHQAAHDLYIPPAFEAPSLVVNSADGYEPSLDEIVAFVNRPTGT